jgi:hypothetical protein
MASPFDNSYKDIRIFEDTARKTSMGFSLAGTASAAV